MGLLPRVGGGRPGGCGAPGTGDTRRYSGGRPPPLRLAACGGRGGGGVVPRGGVGGGLAEPRGGGNGGGLSLLPVGEYCLQALVLVLFFSNVQEVLTIYYKGNIL